MVDASKLDGDLVETFLAVVRFRSLTGAAEHLYTAQSTISHRLRRLEASVGTRLITRSPGVQVVTLTPHGEEFLALAERWEALLVEMTSIGARRRLALSVGATPSVNTYLLPPVYAALAQRDDLKLSIVTGNSGPLYDMLARREIDLAVVGFERTTPEFAVTHFWTEQLVLVTRGNNARPSTGQVSPRSFDPQHELYIDWGVDFQRWHQSWWTASPDAFEVDPAYMAVPLLNDPRRWTILPTSMATALSEAEEYSLHTLTDPPPARHLYFAHRRRTGASLTQAIGIFMVTTQEKMAQRTLAEAISENQ